MVYSRMRHNFLILGKPLYLGSGIARPWTNFLERRYRREKGVAVSGAFPCYRT